MIAIAIFCLCFIALMNGIVNYKAFKLMEEMNFLKKKYKTEFLSMQNYYENKIKELQEKSK